MTVEDTAKTTEDTGLSDEVDTSTNEEALDTEDDTSLEDDSFSFEDVDDDETEESDESTDDEAATESEDDEKEESHEDVNEDESTEESTPTVDDEKKRIAQEAFREREAQRVAREAEKLKQQEEFLQGADEVYEKAIERGLDEGTARLLADQEASNRQVRLEAYNNRIDRINNSLENGIDKAVTSIEEFRTGSPEVKEELAEALDDFERMYVVRDRNGDPIEVKADVLQFLQKKAESIRRLTRAGSRLEQTAKKQVKARTDTLPTRTPKAPKSDDDLDAFDLVANRW